MSIEYIGSIIKIISIEQHTINTHLKELGII